MRVACLVELNSMILLAVSFAAGALTILAPCVLPLLPVVVGGAVINGKKSRPGVIIISFAISVLVFTLLIKVLVDRFGIFPDTLRDISAWILIVFGVVLLFPLVWNRLMHITGIESATNKAQQSTGSGLKGDILLGVTLGPVFNSCSPTFGLLVANILPANFFRGLANILAYILWLVLVLAAIAYGGRKIIARLKWAADPKGWFKRGVAIILIIVGVAILTGRDREVEKRFYEQNLVIDTVQFEGKTLRQIDTECC